jgi:hypothetical protein
MATINTRQLAEIIQRNCTVKKSDVLAVLDELVETLRISKSVSREQTDLLPHAPE